AGACAVGARPVLLAYNLWLRDGTVDEARRVAAAMRGDDVRALGLAVGDHVQVSLNLLSPLDVGPADVYDEVGARVEAARAELVGRARMAVREATPAERWGQLDLSAGRTIEARLAGRW